MCGICGFNWRDEQLLERMKESIKHRGPDDEGSYFHDRVSLGHRRLSIIDLTDRGQQPLSNESGTIWIVFNGEIYNHLELRRFLEKKGHVFRSRTDTEVIVHAYEEFGLECVKRLTGMFSFAIWDEAERRFVLARDRLGLKPLYYYAKHGRFLFASEIKALLCDPELPGEVNLQGLFDLMGYEFVPAPDTLFKDIHKLLPGCLLVFDDEGQARFSRYWSLEVKDIQPTEDALLEILEQVCADHTMSDVPLGTFLSGGIDSSTVVYFLSKSLNSQLQTFALGYSEASFSEFEYARKVAAFSNTNHRELLIRPIDSDAILKYIWHMDEPTTDPSNLPFMLICEQASKWAKVCLSGDGGDEMLMGYDRFRASKASHLLDLIPIPFQKVLYQNIINLIGDNDQKKGGCNILKRFLQGAVLPSEGEHLRWQYFLPSGCSERLFRAEFLSQVNTDPFGPLSKWIKNAPSDRGRREQYIDLNTVLPDSVLMKVDKMSMAHGLEVRPPFLDHRVVEFCYSLPTKMKLRGFKTKWLLKKSINGLLPPGIANRGKQGFSIPMKNWMRDDWMEFIRDEIFSSNILREYCDPRFMRLLWDEHQAMKQNHSHILWTMLNVALWANLFL